jgi:truncated hemoglobin YjbI
MNARAPAVNALPIAAPAANPHYRRLGGDAALRRIVERFYALMDQLPQARKTGRGIFQNRRFSLQSIRSLS